MVIYYLMKELVFYCISTSAISTLMKSFHLFPVVSSAKYSIILGEKLKKSSSAVGIKCDMFMFKVMRESEILTDLYESLCFKIGWMKLNSLTMTLDINSKLTVENSDISHNAFLSDHLIFFLTYGIRLLATDFNFARDHPFHNCIIPYQCISFDNLSAINYYNIYSWNIIKCFTVITWCGWVKIICVTIKHWISMTMPILFSLMRDNKENLKIMNLKYSGWSDRK